MNINLAYEGRQFLLRLIEQAPENPRHTLSPEVEALRRIGDKLCSEEDVLERTKRAHRSRST